MDSDECVIRSPPIRRSLSYLWGSRFWRISAIVFLLVMAWLAWWILPSWPDERHVLNVLPGTDWFHIAADGRSFVCATNMVRQGSYYELPENDIQIYELPSLNHRCNLRTRTWRLEVSPDGSRLMDFWDGKPRPRIYALPSGELMPALPVGDGNDYDQTGYHGLWWSNDGQFLLAFDSQLSVFDKVALSLIQRVPIERAPFNQSPDGRRYVGLSNDGSHLLIGTMESGESFKRIPLPGPQGYDPREPKKRPPPNSVTIHDLAVSNDGTRVFATIHRHNSDGHCYRCVRMLAAYDDSTQTWSETSRDPNLMSMMSTKVSTIKIDPLGRRLATESKHPDTLHAIVLCDHRFPSEDMVERGTPIRTLWDTTTAPLQSLNEWYAIPGGLGYFDPTGKRIIQLEEKGDECKCAIYDAQTLRCVYRHEFDLTEPVFSRDGQWMALEDGSGGLAQSQVSNWVPNWLTSLIPQAGTRIRIVRLSDGAVSRTLQYQDSLSHWSYPIPKFLPDGSLWTVRGIESTDEVCTIAVERWSPEASTPWGMLLITTTGLCAVVWDVRRGYRNRSQS